MLRRTTLLEIRRINGILATWGSRRHPEYQPLAELAELRERQRVAEDQDLREIRHLTDLAIWREYERMDLERRHVGGMAETDELERRELPQLLADIRPVTKAAAARENLRHAEVQRLEMQAGMQDPQLFAENLRLYVHRLWQDEYLVRIRGRVEAHRLMENRRLALAKSPENQHRPDITSDPSPIQRSTRIASSYLAPQGVSDGALDGKSNETFIGAMARPDPSADLSLHPVQTTESGPSALASGTRRSDGSV